jgi:replication fork clamp-binding protein CrfC
MIKLYLANTRVPSESLLNNSVVDIFLIDAPGLNRDSLKTTALFARQEEIDIVVFVVSAENHFTLSAKEFLSNASNEKAYLFIVVNKYDQIKNKDKCKRLVLEQIKELRPGPLRGFGCGVAIDILVRSHLNLSNFFFVPATDKATNKSNHITITNDKGAG